MAIKEEGKSGLRKLAPGEVLFEDGELASSLYIIQKGQLRLYKPKGKGFIEIAVLRAGEVIGEMAYFDDGGGKRSCSASAMVSCEVIEISFTAFSKTMAALNPWFKTIINTLAKRLRQTNARVKELESNSASVNYTTGKHIGYEFFKANDIIKILGTLFLIYKGHAEKHESGLAVHKKTLDLYTREIFGIIESKLDEMCIILTELGLLKIINDKDDLPKIYVLTNLSQIQSLFIFYNTEKHLSEDKKLKISKKCQTFLERIWKELEGKDNRDEAWSLVPVDKMLNEWKGTSDTITLENLDDARLHSIVGEAIVHGDSDLSVEVSYIKLKKMLPSIQFMGRIVECNQQKSGVA